jgi:hypothetical protein
MTLPGLLTYHTVSSPNVVAAVPTFCLYHVIDEVVCASGCRLGFRKHTMWSKQSQPLYLLSLMNVSTGHALEAPIVPFLYA